MAKACGFDFVEMSIDETDTRLGRLDWSVEERKRLDHAVLDTGIRVPTMCLSGHRRFPFGSHHESVRQEARLIVDTPFMDSISKWLLWEARIRSPWFTAFPDVGNLTAWGNNVDRELQLGIDKIAAIHLKDTLPASSSSPGQFREVPFGEGCVDFVSVFRSLKKLNYRGTFLIEMWTEKSNEPVMELFNARRWIESQLIEADWQTLEAVHPVSVNTEVINQLVT